MRITLIHFFFLFTQKYYQRKLQETFEKHLRNMMDEK